MINSAKFISNVLVFHVDYLLPGKMISGRFELIVLGAVHKL